MTHLHTPLKPLSIHTIDVSGGHKLYVEEYGNKDGIPVIFLHGGPGPGFSEAARTFFNPEKFRVIFFDQRGTNRSQPLSGLEENTTQDILSDIEHLRAYFSIDKWHVFGGSWGSTLALLYGIKHPHRSLSLILRGIYLATQAEVQWYFYGVQNFYPELGEALRKGLSEDECQNLVDTYYTRILESDDQTAVTAMNQFLRYEACFSTLIPTQQDFTLDDETKAFMRILIHYFKHTFFLEDNYILNNCAALKDIPIDIVQGRYDTVCPPTSAYQLHKTLPHSQLHMINDAGHSASEKGIALKLTEIMDNL